MGKSRRNHSREFKLEAVKQVVEHGRSVSEVADGLGINRNLLTRWERQLETDGDVVFPGHGRPTLTGWDWLPTGPQRRFQWFSSFILRLQACLAHRRKKLRFQPTQNPRPSTRW